MEEIKRSTIYVVATPIGNLSEITARAIDILNRVSFVCAEDTRHSGKLFSSLGIKTPLVAYHKFNERECAGKIVDRCLAGESCALISDAGMPLISDPGSVLLELARENGVNVTVVSGATALINALVLSGLKTDRFCFIGFLPEKNKDKIALINVYKSLPCTLIFYCAPHDVTAVTEFLYTHLGKRRCAMVREISKIYEQSTQFTLGEPVKLNARGECVLVVEGAEQVNPLNQLSVEEHINHYLQQNLDKMSAIKRVSQDRGVAKSQIYAEVNKK